MDAQNLPPVEIYLDRQYPDKFNLADQSDPKETLSYFVVNYVAPSSGWYLTFQFVFQFQFQFQLS